MSDTIVVMSEGRIQQIGTPIDIYNEPENAFVADFIGESNIVDGIMRQDFSVTFSGHTFTCVDKGFAKTRTWTSSSARRTWTSCPSKRYAARHGHVHHVHGRAL